MSIESKMQGYANFEYDKEPQLLPLKIDYEKLDSLDWTDSKMHNGTFSSGFEFDEKRFVKLTRTGYIHDMGTTGNPKLTLQDRKHLVPIAETIAIPPQEALEYSSEQIEALLSETDVEEFNKKRVELSLRRFAQEKLEVYTKIKGYLGDNLPDFYGSAIIESPRKKLEQGRNSRYANYWPATETTLMEVWENINPDTHIERYGFAGQQVLKHRERYVNKLKIFGEKALALLEEGKIALDIYDTAGIRGFSSEGKPHNIQSFAEMCEYLDGKQEPRHLYPRNIAYDGKRVICFDIYPVEDLSKEISKDTLRKIRGAVVSKNKQQLEEIYAFETFDNKPIKGYILDHCTRYYILLESMGVEL